MNPATIHFSADIPTPHHTYPFQDITLEELRAALEEGMKEEKADIAAITDNAAPPTFENTLVAFERAGVLLDRATTYMYNQLSANTSDALDALSEEMAPRLSRHGADIMQDEKLFQRVKMVKENASSASAPPLTAEQQRLLQRVYERFECSGATLSATDKARFKEISTELSQLTLTFSQNLLKATHAFTLHITDEDALKGLPETSRSAAADAARERGLEGWVFTLQAPSYIPFMTYAERRDLRRQLYTAYATRCAHAGEWCNFDVVKRIVNLRREKAALLGYHSYADYVLKYRMAESVDGVYALLQRLKEAYLPEARREVAEVEAWARRQQGSDFVLQPWDFAYYSRSLKQHRFDIDADKLRPYFELSAVIKGVLGLSTRLYGITFRENKQIQTYHPEVKAYEVYDNDGSFLAVLYTDFHPRASKQGGAWMTNYKEEWDYSSRPQVAITMNLTPPTAESPALLTHDEVETFLHEFGHALHSIFANTRYPSLSGTNVAWDFVELPSQFMENYAVEPDFLKTFARHYQTGEPLPDAWIERLVNSRNFNAAYNCIRQLSFGYLDMAYYTLTEELTADIPSFEKEAWEEIQLLPALPEACMTVQFSHIMSGGYAAGYYSYKWAEVLDADAFGYFKERGIFHREVAGSFRRNVLSQGDTRPPMDLYCQFRGRKPMIDALLRRNGLLPS
jgi:peptidyl-dipeptidase Dcp